MDGASAETEASHEASGVVEEQAMRATAKKSVQDFHMLRVPSQASRQLSRPITRALWKREASAECARRERGLASSLGANVSGTWIGP